MSHTTSGADTLNNSVSSKFNEATSVILNGQLDFGVLKIGGKEGSNLSMYTYLGLSNGDGVSGETSTTMVGGTPDFISLLYDKKSSSVGVFTRLRYVEPLNEKWSLNLTASGSINYVKNLGNETTAGKGEWLMSLAPEMDYYYDSDSFRASLYYLGSTQQPSNSQMSPMLNMGDATMISAGNIYLRPYMYNYLGGNIWKNNRETFAFISANFYGRLQQNGIVQASWFDSDAIRYSVPVNSKKPSYNLSGNVTYNKPFGNERRWTFSTYINASFSGNESYQATSQLEGMDIEKFDYADFMSQFWGNADGDRFYSGESGFAQSSMRTLHYALDLGMKYQRDRFNTSVHAYGRNQISKYSLDPDANANTWMHSYSIEAMYTTPGNWEFSTKCNANFYIGYSAGFGAPQYNWNASISKTIKAVTLSVKGIDLLNQAHRNLQRTATDEYILDTYRNVLGRYFLVSVSFNFGKMNAKKSQAVQDATWNLAF